MGLYLILSILIINTGIVSAGPIVVEDFPKGVGTSVYSDILVADIDGDGLKEINVAPDNRMIYSFKPDGSLLFKNVAGIQSYDQGRKPAVIDLEDDGKLELIVYGNPGVHYAYFYIFNSSGIIVNQILIGMNMIATPASVTEDKIILTGVSPGNPAPPYGATGVYAFDSSGKKLWYRNIGMVKKSSSIAVGDIDGDGIDEAGVVIYNGVYDFKLVIMKIEQNKGTVLWEKNVGSRISGVVFGDVNNDGSKDVVIGSGSGVYAWDGSGSLLWSNSAPSTTNSVPTIADIDGNGVNDVLVGSDRENTLYAISDGIIMPGFPVYTRKPIWTSPAVADFDGDGKLDIAAGDVYRYVYAWDYTGKPFAGFPFIPSSGYFMSSPVMDDIDGDGIVELVIANNYGTIYAWTVIPKDVAPPVTTDDADGVWYNTATTINLTAYDDGSGVHSTYYTIDGSEPTTGSEIGNEILLIEEGIHTIKYFSVDSAGNMEEVSQATVKIDMTPPEIEVTVPVNGDYLHSDVVIPDYSAMDGLSGLSSIKAAIDGKTLSDGDEVDMLELSNGIHEFLIEASDNAGNTVERIIIFRVVSSLDSLIALNERAPSSGWITNVDVAERFGDKLELAKQKLDAGQETTAMNLLNMYINEIDAKTGKTVTLEGAQVIKNEALYVVDSLDTIQQNGKSR